MSLLPQGIPSMPTLIDGSAYRIQPTTASPLAYYDYPSGVGAWGRMTYGPFNPPSHDVSADPAIITLNVMEWARNVILHFPWPERDS